MNKRILIVAPNWIGDAVLSLPVVDGCAQFWPEADLTVLARAGVATLFEARESALRIIELEERVVESMEAKQAVTTGGSND